MSLRTFCSDFFARCEGRWRTYRIEYCRFVCTALMISHCRSLRIFHWSVLNIVELENLTASLRRRVFAVSCPSKLFNSIATSNTTVSMSRSLSVSDTVRPHLCACMGSLMVPALYRCPWWRWSSDDHSEVYLVLKWRLTRHMLFSDVYMILRSFYGIKHTRLINRFRGFVSHFTSQHHLLYSTCITPLYN